jgi:hypothetical protein
MHVLELFTRWLRFQVIFVQCYLSSFRFWLFTAKFSSVILFCAWEGGGYDEYRTESNPLPLYSSHSIQELIWLHLVSLRFNSYVSFIFFSWQTKLITTSSNFKPLKNKSKWQKHLPIKTLEDLIKAGNIWSPFLGHFLFVFLFNILFWSGLRSAVLWGHFVPSDPFTGCHSDRFGQAGAELWL